MDEELKPLVTVWSLRALRYASRSLTTLTPLAAQPGVTNGVRNATRCEGGEERTRSRAERTNGVSNDRSRRVRRDRDTRRSSLVPSAFGSSFFLSLRPPARGNRVPEGGMSEVNTENRTRPRWEKTETPVGSVATGRGSLRSQFIHSVSMSLRSCFPRSTLSLLTPYPSETGATTEGRSATRSCRFPTEG